MKRVKHTSIWSTYKVDIYYIYTQQYNNMIINNNNNNIIVFYNIEMYYVKIYQLAYDHFN